MSLPTNSLQNHPYRQLYAQVAPYLAPSIAAYAAMIPSFYGFIVKSALQTGESVPKMGVKELAKKSVKMPLMSGMSVGTQMLTQNIFQTLFQGSKQDNGNKNRLTSMLASSTIVGLVSAPLLAIFNGQTLGLSAKQSLNSLSIKQLSAIVTREIAFIFSLAIAEPLTKQANDIYGESKIMSCVLPFITGALGSTVGYPADTALTLWQRNLPIKNVSQLMRGWQVKAISAGVFSVIYTIVKEKLTQNSLASLE